MFKKLLLFLTITFLLVSVAPNLAKSREEVTGEEELFVKEEPKEDVGFKNGFWVTVGFEFDWIQAYGFSEQLFAMQNEALELRLQHTTVCMLSENLKIYVVVPHICKYAFVGRTYFFEEDWDLAIGLGDIRGGFSYSIMSERRLPINLVVNAELISNTATAYYGSSENPRRIYGKGFERPARHDLQLGNGFWNIASGLGISKTDHHYRSMLFGNMGYVYRFKERFQRVTFEDRVIKTTVEYHPRNISFYNLGSAFAVGEKSWLGLEFQYTSGVRVEDGYASDLRLGITLKEVKGGVLTEIGFLGVGWLGEWEEDPDYWLLTLTLPLRLKIFNVSF